MQDHANEFVFKRKRKRLRITVRHTVSSVAVSPHLDELHSGYIATLPEPATSSPVPALSESPDPKALGRPSENIITVEKFLRRSVQTDPKTKQAVPNSVPLRRPRAYTRQRLAERQTVTVRKVPKVPRRQKGSSRIAKTLFRATVLADGNPLDSLVDGAGVSLTRRPLKFEPFDKFARLCGLGNTNLVEHLDPNRRQDTKLHIRQLANASDASNALPRKPLDLVPLQEAEAAYSVIFPFAVLDPSVVIVFHQEVGYNSGFILHNECVACSDFQCCTITQLRTMQAYLAEKYMSGAKAEAILSRTVPKKKKRKAANGATSGPSMLVDDDAGFGDEGLRQRQEDEMDAAEAAVASDRSFKKRRTDERSGWTTVREGVKREESPPIPLDEQPTVVEDEPRPFKGGLIRPEDLQKSKTQIKQDEMTKEEVEAAQETVYRDASGRKIDMKLARAEAARKKREQEEKEAQKMEWGKGLVQREEEENRKIQLEKNKSLPFSRRADDEELNEEQMARDRWEDPAAAFLTKKAFKVSKKPEYRGPPPPPNRFGIKPGYRWDGVDRSNGFEKKWFQHINERKRTDTASYAWSVDDM